MDKMGKEIQWPITDDSILLLIQYRSLYILKRKFEIFKSDLSTLYSSFESPSFKDQLKNHKVIDITGFEPLLNSVALLTNMLIIPINKPNELYIVDLYNQKDNEAKSNETKHSIALFAKEYINKYNQLYYTKRIQPVLNELLKEPEPIKETLKEIPLIEGEVLDTVHKMTQYDKKGRVVYTYAQLKEMNSLDYDYAKAKQRKENKDKEAKNSNETEDIESIIENGKLFAETLPLIIADYILKNPNVVIIDLDRDKESSSNGELITEVRGIFDKEIIRKLAEDMSKLRNEIEELNNESNAKLKRLKEQLSSIGKNIELYKRLLAQAEANNDPNAVYLREILLKLERERKLIEEEMIKCIGIINKDNDMDIMTKEDTKRTKADKDKDKSQSPKQRKPIESLLTKEERKEAALKEIFHFYANQHNFAGLFPLFESIQQKINHLDLSEFSKFCVEFSIDVSKETLVELFKKNSQNRKQMDYKEFKIAMGKISLAMSNSRRQHLLKRIDKTKENLMLMNNNSSHELKHFRRKSIFTSASASPDKPNDSSNTKEDHNTHRVPPRRASFLFNSRKNQLSTDLIVLENELSQLSKMTHNDILDKFYTHLGIDAEYSYRKKMKGFIIPFHDIKERHLYWDTNVHADNSGDNSRKLPPIVHNKEQIELNKLKIMKEKQLKESKLKKMKQESYRSKVSALKKKNLQLEVHSVFKLKEKNYMDMIDKEGVKKKIQTEIIDERNKNQFTWERIEKMEELDELKLELDKDKEREDEKKDYSNKEYVFEDLFSESDNSDNLELLYHLKSNDNEVVTGVDRKKEDRDRDTKGVIEGLTKSTEENEKVFLTEKPNNIQVQLPIVNINTDSNILNTVNTNNNHQINFKLFQKNIPIMNTSNEVNTIKSNTLHMNTEPTDNNNNKIQNSHSLIKRPLYGKAKNNRYDINSHKANRQRPLMTSGEKIIYPPHSYNRMQNIDNSLLSNMKSSKDKSSFDRLLVSRIIQEQQLNQYKARTIQRLNKPKSNSKQMRSQAITSKHIT